MATELRRTFISYDVDFYGVRYCMWLVEYDNNTFTYMQSNVLPDDPEYTEFQIIYPQNKE